MISALGDTKAPDRRAGSTIILVVIVTVPLGIVVVDVKECTVGGSGCTVVLGGDLERSRTISTLAISNDLVTVLEPPAAESPPPPSQRASCCDAFFLGGIGKVAC